MSDGKIWPSWRYHASEPQGRIFEHPEDVPAGWVQSPADIGKEMGELPSAAAPVSFDGLSYDNLRDIAQKSGTKTDKRWGRARLEAALTVRLANGNR